MLRFMNAYSCKNLIKMHPTDKCYTAFYANNNVLWYNIMSFELVNLGLHMKELSITS